MPGVEQPSAVSLCDLGSLLAQSPQNPPSMGRIVGITRAAMWGMKWRALMGTVSCPSRALALN